MSAQPADLPAPRVGRTYDSLTAAWVPLFSLCLAFFVEMVDNTVLSIALPTIGRELGAGTTALQWVTGAYSLTFGGLLLTAGSIADRFGRRRVLLTGLAAFGIISAFAEFVTSAGQLIALRAALGVAAALMAPITMSLLFRLFDDEVLRMRAITIVMIVGMSGFALGPILAGTALTSVRWQWLLLVNVPLAATAFLGVTYGTPKDEAGDLNPTPLDLPGAAFTIGAMGLGCYTLTSGVENGWSSVVTIACAVGAVLMGVGFVLRERSAKDPMFDLALLSSRTVRGATGAQLGSSLAMSGIMFGLVLHFQYAFGWSAVRAGLANLPMVITMLAATPLAEGCAKRFGHRVACLIGSALLVIALVGTAWSVNHGYLPIAIFMVLLTIGLRIIMTICAIALVEAMPENRTSVGAALNDTSQEIGTSLGVAVFGTVITAIAGAALAQGTWSTQMVHTFFHAEQVAYALLAVLVGIIAFYGSSTLTDSRTAEESH